MYTPACISQNAIPDSQDVEMPVFAQGPRTHDRPEEGYFAFNGVEECLFIGMGAWERGRRHCRVQRLATSVLFGDGPDDKPQ